MLTYVWFLVNLKRTFIVIGVNLLVLDELELQFRPWNHFCQVASHNHPLCYARNRGSLQYSEWP